MAAKRTRAAEGSAPIEVGNPPEIAGGPAEPSPDVSKMKEDILRPLAHMLGLPNVSQTSIAVLRERVAAALPEPRPLVRTIDDLPAGLQFSDATSFFRLEAALGSFNCHHGQRKLFFALLEFMLLSEKRLPLRECAVVYVGAAPGYNIYLVAHMFPEVQFILVDPASFDQVFDPNHGEPPKNVRFRKERFGDDRLPALRAQVEGLKRQHVLFVSDIRFHNSERNVMSDMQDQQRWAIKLDAVGMMFKFRLPYFGLPVAAQAVVDAERLLGIQDRVERPPEFPVHGRDQPGRPAAGRGKAAAAQVKPLYLYLDGEVRTQLYAPLRSAETRLLVFREPRTRFRLRYYDYEAYEAKMHAFNTVHRSLLHFYLPDAPEESAGLGNHLLGYGDDSESVAEYALARDVMASRPQALGTLIGVLREAVNSGNRRAGPGAGSGADHPVVRPNAPPSITLFLYVMNELMLTHYSSRVSLVMCAIKTMIQHTTKHDDELTYQQRKDLLAAITRTIVARFKRQYPAVKQLSALEPQARDAMILAVERDIQALQEGDNSPSAVAMLTSGDDADAASDDA